ncbi:MAG: 50S ribosomal protein L1 [Phycisphaerae bacterium]|nr:50S ribosomal protein L1 [Phycisphaerae bacterium]
MPKIRGKRYRESLPKIPSGKLRVAEAVKALKALPTTKFDATVDLVMHLGIDAKQADQALRGAVSLPHGIGVSKKVIAFCEGEDVDRAKDAGAIEAGGEDLIKKISDGWMDFDVAITTPAMMRNVSKLGRILGPQGKMPSPKSGTVVNDIPTAVKEYAAGKVEFRTDDGGNVHAPVGKMSFDEAKLAENVEAFISHIKRLKPPTARGVYIRRACLSATMSPSISLDVE